ncbi:MAG TPA: FCD domain-containing protein, partial [Methylomirabilota bacterium]|nr:FCD domain-containing protein [Methylomirabilota bacterium]
NPVLFDVLNYLSDLVFRSHRAVTQSGGLSPSAITYHERIAAAIRRRAPREARRVMLQHLDDVIRRADQLFGEGFGRRQARTGPRSASRVLRCEPVERARRTERGTWDRTVATDDGVGRGSSAGREPGRGRDRAPLQPRGETSCTT